MKKCLLVTFIIVISCSLLNAQELYKLPPKEVIDIVSAPPTPEISISPTGDFMLLAGYESMPSIAYLAQPLLRIAGIRITPKNTSRQQITFYTDFTIKNLKDGSSKEIELPEGAKFGFPQWSFDGKWFAFSRYSDTGKEIWVAETKSGKTKVITPPRVNAVLNSGFRWMPDNSHLLVNIIIEDRGDPPKPPEVPIGPTVQETSGKSSKVWTYQDLLTNQYDEALFEYCATSQTMEIDVLSGISRKIGTPGIFSDAEHSPDGNYILVHKIKKPFSYSVPYPYFTHTAEIWDKDGKIVRILADLPTADEVPISGVPTGPRNFEWRPLESATLVWIEALDEGDPEKEVPHRDKIMTISAPFENEPKEILKIQHRYSGTSWFESKGTAFITEYNWKKRWQTTYLINSDNPDITPKKIFDLSSQDLYNDPGRLVSKTTKSGESIVFLEGDWFYLSGSGASPEGDRPFLDRMNIKTMEKQRLFQSGKTSYESFIDFSGDSKSEIIISYESKTEPPNYFLLNLKTNKRKSLTDFKDPAPRLTGIKKQLIKYVRNDGTELSGTLYLPQNYKEGERLPLVIWAYPIEYSDPKIAGQVSASPNMFTFFRGISQLFFVTQGYALLDDAQMPVIGDPKTMNETFIDQIVSSAKAAIDKLDEMGIIDPKRVGVGGHSYGAFMTANLLAHSDLFSAGIARSGAYNRTLTPFGFQSERRTLWEAPDLYFKISPFMYADKINEPILLIHGEADNNAGTFPIQSERLYDAVKGHGATARLVMLPYESHGYSAKESVLDVLAEMFEWFDKYVKNKK